MSFQPRRLAAADMAPLLSDATLARRLELAEVMLAMEGMELVECPGCGGRCEPPPLCVLGESSSVVRCPTSACHRAFCIHCRQPPHTAGVRCREAAAAASASMARRSAAAQADASFLDQMDREHNARCQCGTWVEVSHLQVVHTPFAGHCWCSHTTRPLLPLLLLPL